MYIVSQIFVIISYILLAITYLLKKRNFILQVSVFSLIASLLAFGFLSAWSGMAMMGIAIIRNLILWIQDKKYKTDNITKIDYLILFFLYSLSITFAIFTYDGLFSLLSVLATMVYTYSVWQKSPKIYKLLGIPSSVLWVCYNIFVNSILGIILESFLVVFEVVGLVKHQKKEIYK